MRKIVLSEEQLQKIREYYNLGYSKLKIGKELNIGKDTINRAFLEWDIPNNLNTGDKIVSIIKYYVYVIQNRLTNKIYVGQTKDLKKRWRAHRNETLYKNTNKPIYNSMRKYGIDNFSFQDIETFDNLEDCNEAEEFWIQFFQSTKKEFGYNIAFGGDNHEHTPETKAKISKIRTGTKASPETKKKMSDARQGKDNPMFGKIHSNEAKNAISEANKGKLAGENNPFYGKTHSEETRKLLSEVNKGRHAGEKNPMFGKPRSKETRKKISEANKKWHRENKINISN